MRNCCLCKKKVGGNGSFFRIPTDERRRNMWSEVCQMEFTKQALICLDHFLPSDIIIGTTRNNLMPSAVPYILPLQENTTPGNDSVQYPLYELCDSNNNIPPNLNLDIPIEVSFNVPERCVEYADAQTQTNPTIFESAMRVEYKRIIKELQDENKNLKYKLAEADAVVTSLKTIFTDGQIRKLMTHGTVQWNWTDISNAICLQASGPRAYNHMYRKGYPLPHVSTLQRWSRKVNLDEGIISTAVDFMKQNTSLTNEDKICVLAFDEMKVTETYEYDAVGDFVRKPANYVQVVIARGLKKSWKQPVFYDFDCQMKKEILCSIITDLYHAGYPVVAMVCDMGSTNRKLWKELGVTLDKPWFPNPANVDEKVFAFADAPHLLKLIRNHFLDSGLFCNNELLTSRTVADLLKHTSHSDISITFKLNDEHISVKGVGRQKVKLAAQLFSNTTANAIRRCYSVGLDIYKPIETADLFQLVNDWFDIMNSTLDNLSYPGKEPYGIALAAQQDTLRRMNQLMSTLIIPNKKTLEFFQRGIIMSNNALEMLHEYTKQRYKMSYIVTNRLNQDVDEHFFGNMRSKGGLYDHPTPKEFKYRLRKYILARSTEYLQDTGNVEHDTTQWLGSMDPLPSSNVAEQRVLDEYEKDCDHEVLEEISGDVEVLYDLHKEDIDDDDILRDDALEYVSGYIIRKHNLEEYECKDSTFTWVDQVSKGFLKKPSAQFVETIKRLELVFHEYNKKDISHHKNIKQCLIRRSIAIDLPEKIKLFFFKCRTHFRVKHLNKRLKIKKAKQRIMGFRKMIKINL